MGYVRLRRNANPLPLLQIQNDKRHNQNRQILNKPNVVPLPNLNQRVNPSRKFQIDEPPPHVPPKV